MFPLSPEGPKLKLAQPGLLTVAPPNTTSPGRSHEKLTALSLRGSPSTFSLYDNLLAAGAFIPLCHLVLSIFGDYHT